MNGSTQDARFVDLEVKIAYLEKTMDDLNEVVVMQARQLEVFERRVRQLERLRQEEAEPNTLPHERPPHY